MTGIKELYGRASGFLAKHHIRGIYILIILYVVIVTVINPVFLTGNNIMNLLRQVAVVGVISCGITFVMLTGRTDLSAGMMMTYLAAISCYFVLPGVNNQFMAILAPLVLGLVFGLVNGILVGVIRLNSFVSTLGMMSIYTGAVLLFTKRNPSLFADNEMAVYKFIGQGSVLGVPTPVIILLIVAFICSCVLKKTVYGARIYAVGSNVSMARFSGINPAAIIVSTYVIAGLATGLGALIMASRIMAAQPKMGVGYEFTALTAIVLGGLRITGGKGTIWGTIIGVVILGIIDNSFVILGLDSNLQYVVKGIILAVAVASQLMSDRRQAL